MQHRVRRTAEGHVAFHGVVHGSRVQDVLDAHAVAEQFHHLHAGALGQTDALGVDGRHGAVARKGDPQGLAQTIHGVRREHARAAAAGGAGRVLEVGQLLFGHGAGGHLPRPVEERVQIGGALPVGARAGEHGAAGDEDRGHVRPQGPQDHAGNDLVAVRDAHQAVEGVPHDGAFHGIGNDLARDERVVHALMVHGDAVAHADGADFEGDAAGHVDAGLHGLGDLVEVGVTGNDVVARAQHRDEGAIHLLVGDAVRLEQAAVRRARHPSLDLVASQLHRPRFLSRSNAENTKTRCKMHRAGKRDARATTRREALRQITVSPVRRYLPPSARR